jgi:predicted Zn-dependent protease
MKKALVVLLYICLAAASETQDRGQGGGVAAPGKTPPADLIGALSEMDRAFEDPEEEFSPEDSYYLGRAVAAQILTVYTLYTRDSPLIFYLNMICHAIALNSPQPTAFKGYSVGVLNTGEINAFATPGGHIFLTRGLVECAGSEDALAAVIAHELAHIQLRHAETMIKDQRLVHDLSQTADRAAALVLRNLSPQERVVFFDRNIRDMVNTFFKNGFAQSQEFEADIMAVSLLHNAGYDPSALVTMLQVLETVQPLNSGGFNTTHPSPAARLANLEKISLTGEGRTTRAYRISRFTSLQAEN